MAEGLKIGDKIPELDTVNLEGKPVRLSDFKDKILIIDFWATWCVPCVREFPHFDKFHKKFKDKGVELIAISIDNNLKKVVKFNKRKNYSFTILHDTNKKTVKSFKVNKVPTLFIIGPDHKVRYEPIEGGKRNIDELLEEKIKTIFNK